MFASGLAACLFLASCSSTTQVSTGATGDQAGVVADDSPPVEVATTIATPTTTAAPVPLAELGPEHLTRFCGNAQFDMAGDKPTNGLPMTDELEAIMGQVRASDDWGWFASEFDEWTVLYADGEWLSIHGFGPGHGFAIFQNNDQGWMIGGLGDCQMELRVAGYWNLNWMPVGDLTNDLTEITIAEDTCGDGEATPLDAATAVAVEQPDRVTIVLLREPVEAPLVSDDEGEAIEESLGCYTPENPTTLTVELKEPLGDRALFDGSQYGDMRQR